MTKDIFRTVTELLDSRDAVARGNAVHSDGYLYPDSVENLNALRMLEPSLRELVRICVDSGLKCTALTEVIELIGFEGEDELTGDDARELLAVLDNLVTSIDENVSGDFSEDIDQSLWDDYGKALNVLRDYGIREQLKPIYRRALK